MTDFQISCFKYIQNLITLDRNMIITSTLTNCEALAGLC